VKLKALIAKGEGKKVEFKEVLPNSDKIMKTAVAFSNGAGGKLIIGVKDNGQIVGISDEYEEFESY
jgi:ATP-dependent DNA helicase RecG